MSEANVVDVSEDNEAKEPIKISKADHEQLLEMGNHLDQLHFTLGGIEVKKVEIINQVFTIKRDWDVAAKQAILNAGIAEDQDVQ